MRTLDVKFKNKCLSDRDIILFIDRKSDFDGYDRVVSHMSICEECLDKTIEIKKCLETEEVEIPHGLSEKVFRKSALEIGKSMFHKSIEFKKTVGTLAVAASVFIIVLVGITGYKGADVPSILEKNKSGNFSNPVKINNLNKYSTVKRGYSLSPKANPIISSASIQKSAIQKEEMIENPLVYAGYLFFLISNSGSVDKELLDKFYTAISDSELDQDTSAYLIEQRWFSLLMREVSQLPEKEREDFSEGYIFSLLYHSDNRGRVNGNTIEWGVKLAVNASMNEIRQCMLYQRSGLKSY